MNEEHVPIEAILAEVLTPLLFRRWLEREGNRHFPWVWGGPNPIGLYLRELRIPATRYWFVPEWPAWVRFLGRLWSEGEAYSGGMTAQSCIALLDGILEDLRSNPELAIADRPVTCCYRPAGEVPA